MSPNESQIPGIGAAPEFPPGYEDFQAARRRALGVAPPDETASAADPEAPDDGASGRAADAVRLALGLLGALVVALLAASASVVPASASPAGDPARVPAAVEQRSHALPIAPPRRLLDDLREADAAFASFDANLRAGFDEAIAADDDAPLFNRLPALRADLAAFDAALTRLRTYRMTNPGLERRRRALAVAGPRFAAVLQGFVNSIESRDLAALVRIGDRLETESEAYVRAARGTPNVSPGRFLGDLGRVSRILDRIARVVRRPTPATVRRARSALIRHRRSLDAVMLRMRNYRLQNDDLERRRAAAVRNATALRRSLNIAIGTARTKRGVAAARALARAVADYERRLRRSAV